MGVEVTYNLDTLERAVFDVRGFVISRLSLMSVGRADYIALGSGTGVKDYGILNEKNDLGRDYGGIFINDCGSAAPSLFSVSIIEGSGCIFYNEAGTFAGESVGTFDGIDVNVPIPTSPNPLSIVAGVSYAVSWSELNYHSDPGKYKAYGSVHEMANDILAGNESPLGWNSAIASKTAFSPSNRQKIRVTMVALLNAMQFGKGNLPVYQ